MTGEFDGGLYVGTLEQTFTIAAAEPFLSFDFKLPSATADTTGSNAGLFTDAYVVSITSTFDYFVLLIDRFDAIADPSAPHRER